MLTFDSSSLAALGPQECLGLLAVPGEAQVNLTRHPLPEPLTLDFRLDGSALLLRPEGPLGAVLAEADVTVEVGATDRYAHTGWRVVVTGRAEPTRNGGLRLLPSDMSGYRIAARRSA